MPNLEPVVLQQDKVRVRHIGPQAAIWPDPPGALHQFALLNRSDMVARALDVSNIPGSPDFVSGSWTGRLDDAGESQLVFPNTTASDGLPWRSRFSTVGHLEFLEIYFNDELDSVCVIDQTSPTQAQVTVHGDDGWWLLKKAYVRDWLVTQAPRDVIERGTKLWVSIVADDFASGTVSGSTLTTPFGTYGIGVSSGGSVAMGASGNVLLSIAATIGSAAEMSKIAHIPAPSGVWTSTMTVELESLTAGTFSFGVSEDLTTTYNVQIAGGFANLQLDSGGSFVNTASVQLLPNNSYAITLESDGEWFFGFVNGQLIGAYRRLTSVASSTLTPLLSIAGGSVSTAVVSELMVKVLTPFLQRGADKGDYVLAGDATTYPSGGLSARYFNDLDLQSDPSRLSEILSPPRTQAYGGSSPAEYADQQDPQINAQTNPAGGAASNWSVIWFGAIYLKLSAGDYLFQWQNPGISTSDCAIRIWIGKTQWGDQLVDEWSFSSGVGFVNFGVTAASLAGALPYGGGSVVRDGWYPIKVEFAIDGTLGAAGALVLTNSPASYTDPGGTAITVGSQGTVVPPTSLSPLGMIDQRYQGIAHFDLVQQTLQATGLHASVEPQQLESGLFPGVLAPRAREGHDTDVVLKPDTGPRTDSEGLLNYSSTLDSTDFASSLQGNGAGIQTGTTGQLQAVVYDPATMLDSLFDAQQWQDFSDASLSPLLQALLNSQLGLQLDPWQSLSADPTGRPRKAFTWPLTGAIAKMRWRPGDGLFVRAPLINVNDTVPRQMLVVTRNIGPQGIQSTQATFANRPKNPARTLKRQLYSATRLQRNYQKQILSLTGSYQFSSLTAGVVDPGLSIVSLSAGDTVVGARLIVTYVSANDPLDVYVNGALETATLNGPWAGAPLNINLTPVASPTTNSQLYVRLLCASASIAVQYQLVVDVLR